MAGDVTESTSFSLSPWERAGVRGFASQQKAWRTLTLTLSRQERGQETAVKTNLAHPSRCMHLRQHVPDTALQLTELVWPAKA